MVNCVRPHGIDDTILRMSAQSLLPRSFELIFAQMSFRIGSAFLPDNALSKQGLWNLEQYDIFEPIPPALRSIP